MRKLSKQATLHLMLQGLWKGIQEAKTDPKVMKKYPKGLGWVEKFVVDLGKKARNPKFKLTQKQVDKLNEFLVFARHGSNLSKILRKHIVKHCKGNQCEILSPNTFHFKFVEDEHDSGAILKTMEQATKEFYDSQGSRDRYRDSKMTAWQEDPNQSLEDFKKEIYSQWRGLPGSVEFYYDPKEKKHFAFATYNTF
jgi:hypothetical protein